MKVLTLFNKWVALGCNGCFCQCVKDRVNKQTCKEQYCTYFWNTNKPLITYCRGHNSIKYI